MPFVGQPQDIIGPALPPGKSDAGTEMITQEYLFGETKATPQSQATEIKEENSIFAPVDSFQSSVRFKQIVM